MIRFRKLNSYLIYSTGCILEFCIHQVKDDFDSVEAELDSCDDGQSSGGDSEPEVGDRQREESGTDSPATFYSVNNQTSAGGVLLEPRTLHAPECLTSPAADSQPPPSKSESKRAFLRRLELYSQVVSLSLKSSGQDQSTRPATEEKKVRKRHMTGRASLSVRPVDGESLRGAGRSLFSSSNPGVQGLRRTGKKSENLATPPRTAPSIPSSHGVRQQFGVRPVHGAQAYMSELEHHAHKMSTPLKFVEKGMLFLVVLRQALGRVPCVSSSHIQKLVLNWGHGCYLIANVNVLLRSSLFYSSSQQSLRFCIWIRHPVYPTYCA